MTNFLKQKKSGFTLIELLVVIAIIGILSTLAVVALQNARSKARDSKRIADVKQMQTALELYFNDNGSYPTSVTSTIATSGIVYMASMPTAPTPVDGSCDDATNAYTYNSDGSTYSIAFCLGGGIANLSSGQKVATRDGIREPTPWVCGDVLTDSRDSQQYPTVLIGAQCWMAKNLAYLPLVQDNATFSSLGGSSQPAYGVYGYNGNDVVAAKALANYTTYGVLYNWYAAMAGSTTEGAKGSCPTGWHVPSSADFTNLSTYLGTDSVAGGKLKQTGTDTWAEPNTGATNEIGFTALSIGNRAENGGSFVNKGWATGFWSSLSVSSANAGYRYLSYENSNFSDYSYVKARGFSVRCIKN